MNRKQTYIEHRLRIYTVHPLTQPYREKLRGRRLIIRNAADPETIRCIHGATGIHWTPPVFCPGP